jgi:hypothetical protein
MVAPPGILSGQNPIAVIFTGQEDDLRHSPAMKHRSRITALLGLTLLLPSCAAHRGSSSHMEILGDDWHLTGFDNALDLSGIATSNGTQVLVGSDESFYVQPGEVEQGKRTIESRRLIALPVKKGGGGEVDIEGIAFSKDDRAYYVVGSHGVGRKKGDFKEDRHSIYHVPVDADGRVRKDKIRRASLLQWLEKTPSLEPYLKQPLQQNGLNIEGLAWSGGKLYFGLRAPNQNGRGMVIEAAPAEIFGGKPRELMVHEVAIPKGRGIREIAAVRDGFLIVAGNASAEASKKFPVTLATGPDTDFDLFHWTGPGSTTASKVGKFPGNGGKAEALLLLEDEADHADLLVLFDGLPGGGPLRVRVHR